MFRTTIALLTVLLVSCSESSFTGDSSSNAKKSRGGNAADGSNGMDGGNGGDSSGGNNGGADSSVGSTTGADGSLTESFSFTGTKKSVDILFALDTSGSMSEELGFLAQKFSLFTSEIAKFGLDANVVVIYDKSKEMDGIASSFKQHKARVGSNDALCVIRDYFANPTSMGMLRAGVPLEVFVVTDDNAGGKGIIMGPDGLPKPPSEGTECKSAVFQPPADKKTTFSGIVGLKLGKNTDTCNIAAVGEEYKLMAPKYGGNIYDLCTQDWGALVKDMAGNVGQRIRKFKLKENPDLAKGFTVQLNGKVLPASEYTYDAATNTITISGAAVEAQTDKVEVKYFPKK